MSQRPPNKASLQELALWLTITRPLLSVLRPLHVLGFWFAASAGAVLTGFALAGTPSSPTDRGLGVACWFVASMIFSGWWVMRQRADRPALPGHRDVPFYWTAPATSLLFALFFSPAIGFEIAAASAIRARVDQPTIRNAAAVFQGGGEDDWRSGRERAYNQVCPELSRDENGQVSAGRLSPFATPHAIQELWSLCANFREQERRKTTGRPDRSKLPDLLPKYELTKVTEPIMAAVSSCAEAHEYPFGTYWLRPPSFYVWMGMTILAATAMMLTNVVTKRVVGYSVAGAIGAALLLAVALEGSRPMIWSFSGTLLGSIVGSFLAVAALMYLPRKRTSTMDVLFSVCWFGPVVSVFVEMLLNGDAFETHPDPTSGRPVLLATSLDGEIHGLEIGVILLMFYCVSSIVLLPGVNRYRRLPRHR